MTTVKINPELEENGTPNHASLVGYDMRGDAVIHVHYRFPDASEFDGVVVVRNEFYYTPETVLDTVVRAVKDAEKRSTPKKFSHSYTPLPTSDFSYDSVVAEADGGIVIQYGYDGHTALSYEITIRVSDQAEYFRLFGKQGYPWDKRDFAAYEAAITKE